MIHPSEFAVAARLSQRYDVIQFPVLALQTPFWKFTHGVYCDEFAESHWKDLRLRAALGGFVPSAGVGACFRRETIDRLRIQRGFEVFDPRSLTEDHSPSTKSATHPMPYDLPLPVHRLVP